MISKQQFNKCVNILNAGGALITHRGYYAVQDNTHDSLINISEELFSAVIEYCGGRENFTVTDTATQFGTESTWELIIPIYNNTLPAFARTDINSTLTKTPEFKQKVDSVKQAVKNAFGCTPYERKNNAKYTLLKFWAKSIVPIGELEKIEKMFSDVSTERITSFEFNVIVYPDSNMVVEGTSDLMEALNIAHELDEASKQLSNADELELRTAAKKLGYTLDKDDFRDARKLGVQAVISGLQKLYTSMLNELNSSTLSGKIVAWKYVRTRLSGTTWIGYDVTIQGTNGSLYHSLYSTSLKCFLGKQSEPFDPFMSKVNSYDEIVGSSEDSTIEEWNMSGLADDITAVIRGCTVNGTDLSEVDHSVELSADESYIKLSYVDANNNTYSTRITDVYSAPEGSQALMNWIESLSWNCETKDVHEFLHEAHKLDEGTTSVRVPAAIRDYVDAYCDAINDLSSYNPDKWDRGTGIEFFDSGKHSSAYADRVMYGVMDNYELNDDQLDAVYKYVEFQEDAEWYDDSSVTNVFDASSLQDDDDDEDEYDDDFEEGLLGTAIQAAKNLNPLNLFEGEGADTTRAIVDILDKTSTEDKPTWVKAVKDVVDVIPDEYMDNLFDIAKEKLSDVQVSEEDKTKIVDAAGVPVDGAQEANTVGKILSLFDITTWDAKTLKTYIVAVLGIVALIEPTPILEIITAIITLLPAEAVKAILSVTNMIGNPVGAAATLVNRAMKSRGSDNLEESFDVGDRVKQTWANPYNVGEVIDTKYDPEKGNLVQVKWDYSDGPEIEWLNCEDVSPYNEEDEKAGYYEGLFDKPKKNRHTDENGNPVLTKLDPPPEGFFDDEAPKLYKAEPAKHKRRHSIFGNKKKPAPAGDPLDDLFDDEF